MAHTEKVPASDLHRRVQNDRRLRPSNFEAAVVAASCGVARCADLHRPCSVHRRSLNNEPKNNLAFSVTDDTHLDRGTWDSRASKTRRYQNASHRRRDQRSRERRAAESHRQTDSLSH